MDDMENTDTVGTGAASGEEAGSSGTIADPQDVQKYIIDNQEDYITFIKKLRATLANRSEGRENIFRRREESPETAHQLLTGRPNGDMFIYIKIAMGEGDEEVPILAIQKDNVYIKGFRNKSNQWFELPPVKGSKGQHLPASLGAKELEDWDETYGGTMKLERREQVDSTLKCARLGRAFANRALRRLWNYDPSPKKEGNNDDDNPIRHGLAGLFVMISEAARMDPFLHTITGAWNGEMGLTEELAEMRREWGNMSAALLNWRDSSYREWPNNYKFSLSYALVSIHLVRMARNPNGLATWVEIFAVSADPPAHKKITIEGEGDIFPKKNFPQKNPQGPKEMYEDRCGYILAYQWFCITVHYDESGNRTKEQFKLPCSNSTTEPVTARYTCGDKKLLDVTYLVMSESDASMATVNVNMLQVPKGDSEDTRDQLPEIKGKGVSGEQGRKKKKYTCKGGQIYAIIGEYDQHRIMLLRSGEECKTMDGKLTLSLPRRQVVVPRDKQLHIYMENLAITDESNKNDAVANIENCNLSFEYLSPTATPGDNSNVVGVDIRWYTDHISGGTDISWDTGIGENKIYKWTIGDDSESFTDLIQELCTDIGAKANVKKVFGIPVLKRYANVPDQWTTHIKVQLEGEKSSITLAIQDEKLIAAGFRNQAGVWYSLTLPTGVKMLGRKYNSIPLDWGGTYNDLLQGTDMKDHMKELGKEFAVKAVRTLSRYPDVEDEDEPRLDLLGLVIMVCDSSIWKPLQKYFEEAWDAKDRDANKEAHKSIDQLTYCVESWEVVSYALLSRDASGQLQKEDLSKENLKLEDWNKLSERFCSKLEGAEEAIQGIQLVFGGH